MIDARSFMIVLPEIEVAVVALVSLVAAAACGARVARHIGYLAVLAFAGAAATLVFPIRQGVLLNGDIPVFAFGTQFIDDPFARFSKLIILVSSILSVFLSWGYFERARKERAEYPVLIMLAVLGMMLMVSASDLLSLYVAIELQSLSLYVLAAIGRNDAKSSEAGLKYFVLGALSSGLLLYGISLIYGFAGTTDFMALASLFRGSEAPLGVVVGLVFVCAALAFKVSGAPFHMWTPDVYEGAPTPVTAFFASAPKFAALALLVRFLLMPMAGLSEQAHQMVAFVAVVSMLWGSFAGLVQTNLKRLLAYSSIANVGALLVGVVVGGAEGIQAVLIYFGIYALNVLGAFAVILCLHRDGNAMESVDDLAGLSRTKPVVAFVMAILMFSLAGIPPLAGFFGKYFVFLAAVKDGWMPLAVIGVLSSVVSAYYYLRIVKLMYFDEPALQFDPVPDWGVGAVLVVSAVAMLGMAFLPSPLIEGARHAAKGFIG